MELPQVRPGVVHERDERRRVLAFFFNSALGNSVVQQLLALGIESDGLGVTPPERIEGGQGMLLSIPCPDDRSMVAVETLCRRNGGQVHRAFA